MESPIPSSEPTVRLLLVDDDADDCLLTREIVSRIPRGRYTLDWVSDYDAGLEAVCKGEHDVYLIDYRIGARTGLELLRETRERTCAGPMILLTGQSAFEIDRAAMEAGAADFLEKGKLDHVLLERSIRYAILQDRTEKALEEKVAERTAKLEAANEALKEAARRKDEFLATLGHELRNPLAPIRNAIEIMRLSADRPQAIEQARLLMERQVGTMVRLINDLMDVARVTRGKLVVSPELLDLRGPLEDALEAVRPNADKAGIAIEHIRPPEPLSVNGDHVRLAQVFTNILSNAVKYTESGGKVVLTAAREDAQAVVRIKDTGVGIPREHLPRIFDLFTQIDRSLNRSQGGLGIGLALVRQLVGMHGGTVSAASEGAGKGTEITVRIPWHG